MNQIRLFVPDSALSLKTSNANRVKGLHGKVTKSIWTHDNPVTINLVTEEAAAPAEEFMHPTKKIRRGGGLPPVSAPGVTVSNPSGAPQNPETILSNFYDDVRGPRLSARVRTEPGRSHKKYRSMGTSKGTKRQVPRPKKDKVKIPPFDYRVPDLASQWLDATRKPFEPNNVS